MSRAGDSKIVQGWISSGLPMGYDAFCCTYLGMVLSGS